MRAIVPMITAFALLAGGAGADGIARVHDQRGATVTVPAPAQRVVTFNSVLWMYLTIDGTSAHIAGASASTVKSVTAGLLVQAFPKAKKIPTDVSADGFFVPNVEAILYRRPQAVFQWVGRNNPTFLDPLDRAGLTVVALRQTVDERDYFDVARMVGAISGKPDRAEGIIDAYRKSYDALKRDVDAALAARGGKRERVLYLWKAKPLTPIDGANFFSTLIERSGGINAAAQMPRAATVGMEKILVWNPDVIILFCCDKTKPEDFYKNPMWSSVAAVRNRRVYKVPAGGSRFSDLIEGPLFSRWLSEILFAEMPHRLRNDLRQRFRTVYGVNLSDAQLDETLHLRENAKSVGYARFARPNSNSAKVSP